MDVPADLEGQEAPEPTLKLKTDIFVLDDEEDLVAATDEQIHSIVQNDCFLTVLSTPRIWSSAIGYGLTWTANQIIIESSSVNSSGPKVCLSRRAQKHSR